MWIRDWLQVNRNYKTGKQWLICGSYLTLAVHKMSCNTTPMIFDSIKKNYFCHLHDIATSTWCANFTKRHIISIAWHLSSTKDSNQAKEPAFSHKYYVLSRFFLVINTVFILVSWWYSSCRNITSNLPCVV